MKTTKWYETNVMSAIWTVLRIWLGIQWLQGGFHKIVGGGFDASGFLHGAIAKAGGEAPTVQGWYAAFLEGFALPNVELFNVLIPYGEFLVGLGLILGAATVPALIAGAFMNLNFLLAGTLSTNPVLLAAAMILLFAGKGAYSFGADRYAVPFIKYYFENRKNNKKQSDTKKAMAV